MRDIEVHGDQMTFNGSSQFFEHNGNVLAVACASGTGTRFEDVGGAGLAVYLRCSVSKQIRARRAKMPALSYKEECVPITSTRKGIWSSSHCRGQRAWLTWSPQTIDKKISAGAIEFSPEYSPAGHKLVGSF